MTDDIARMPVIDVDSHWTEPPDLWTARAPAKFRDRTLRVERNDDGVEQWLIEDGQVMGQVGYCSIRPDGSKSQASIAFDTFDEVHPGAIHVAPRLDYMDEHGLSIQIVYPNILGFAGNLIMRIDDEAHRAFCATAYNDAAAEMQKESGGRAPSPSAVHTAWPHQNCPNRSRCRVESSPAPAHRPRPTNGESLQPTAASAQLPPGQAASFS